MQRQDGAGRQTVERSRCKSQAVVAAGEDGVGALGPAVDAEHFPVEIAFGKQRPAAVAALDAAQIDRDFLFKLGINRLAEVMPQQHVFGGNGGVGLELEHPMAVRTLQRQNLVRAFPSMRRWPSGLQDEGRDVKGSVPRYPTGGW